MDLTVLDSVGDELKRKTMALERYFQRVFFWCK